MCTCVCVCMHACVVKTNVATVVNGSGISKIEPASGSQVIVHNWYVKYWRTTSFVNNCGNRTSKYLHSFA